MSNYYFPEAILREILLRLPIKSLGKCSAVCLPWRSLIQTSAFIHAHLSCAVQSSNQNNTDHLFLRNALAEKEDATHQVDYTNLIATYAFGDDLRIDDYKVLRIVSNKNVKARCRVEVRLLAGGHWKSLSADVIPADFMPAGIAGRYTQAFVNGSPHWLQPSKNEGNRIVSFDMRGNHLER
ncbi:F-box/kelch-repeat protein At3g23880-like [Pyrus communis]|uniref:F-box/kelch-repeat protein At3g23880-like n=1 Tax=Pyrus communis TaxID=23211 RepID=UPI0035BEEC0B